MLRLIRAGFGAGERCSETQPSMLVELGQSRKIVKQRHFVNLVRDIAREVSFQENHQARHSH